MGTPALLMLTMNCFNKNTKSIFSSERLDHLDGDCIVTTLGSVWDPLVTTLWLFCEIQTLIQPGNILCKQSWSFQDNFTMYNEMNFHFHRSQIDWKMTSNRHKFFNLVRNEGYVKKISRGGWSGFGKALTWDPSQTFFYVLGCIPK